MPALLGVACIDINLIVALDKMEARDDWTAFHARVKREREACPRVAITEPQVRTAIPNPVPVPIPNPNPTPIPIPIAIPIPPAPTPLPPERSSRRSAAASPSGPCATHHRANRPTKVIVRVRVTVRFRAHVRVGLTPNRTRARTRTKQAPMTRVPWPREWWLVDLASFPSW